MKINAGLFVLAASVFMVTGVGNAYSVPGESALGESASGKSTADPDRANKILRYVDDLWRGESSNAVITMHVKTAHYTRSMKMDAWSKGKEKSLVRIVSPLKEKGTATLKSSNNIFSYLPRTDRTIRLTSGMMMGSWMGSHFTNDDLVKDSRREDDFVSTISFEGQRNGRSILEFTLIPKPDAAVVWGKVVLEIRAKDYIPLTEIYYDEDMEVTRTITFSDLRQLGGMLRPAIMRVVPADKPDEFTELIYEKLELNIDVKDSFFSISNLKRK
jgi:hypothetical protein